MNFSLIIPTNKSTHQLEVLFHQLLSLNQSRNTAEVILVFNHIFDEASLEVEMKEKIPFFAEKGMELRFCMVKKLGPSYARNFGAKMASHSHLLFLDDDCEFFPDLLDKYAVAWHKYPHAKMIGGKVLVKKENGELKSEEVSLIKRHPWCFAYLDLGNQERSLKIHESLYSTNISYQKESLQEQKIFNERLGVLLYPSVLLGGEDFELCNRLLLENKTIMYIPSLVVWNRVSMRRFTNEYLMKRYFFFGIENYLYDHFLMKISPHFSSYHKDFLNSIMQLFQFNVRPLFFFISSRYSLIQLLSYFFIGKFFLNHETQN